MNQISPNTNFFHQFKQLIQEDKLFAIVLFSLVVLIYPIPAIITGGPAWDNYKFILMAGVLLGSFFVLLFGKTEKKIKIVRSDLAWFIFIALGFSSYFWAIDGALVWYPSFGWLLLVLWMILVRSIIDDKRRQDLLFIVLLGVLLFFLVEFFLLYVTNRLIEPVNWNSYFGYNSNMNYTASYFVSLLPFLLFFDYPSKLTNVIKFIGTCLVLFILYKAKARGAMIAFAFLLLYFFWTILSKKVFWRIFLCFFTGLLGVLFLAIKMPNIFVFVPIIGEFNFLLEFTKNTEFARFYMARNAILIFIEHPLAGVGFGNGGIEAYKGDLSDVIPFNHPYSLIRWRNHNFYSELLAELGILGFLAFLYSCIKIILNSGSGIKTWSRLKKAVLGVFLVYLVNISFYQSTNFSIYNFRETHFLAFLSLGILTANYKKSAFLSKLFSVPVIIFSLSCLLWFIYARIGYLHYKVTKKTSNKCPHISILQLKELFHPEFMTTGGNRTSLGFDLAVLYRKLNLPDEAEKYYRIALEKAPYNEKILLHFSKFLLNHANKRKEAKIYATRFYKIQDNNYDINYLMGAIAYAEMDYENARYYLENLGNVKYNNYNLLSSLILAKIAVEDKNYKKAKIYLKKFDDLKFSNLKILGNLLYVEIAILESKNRKAREFLREVLLGKREFNSIFLQMALLYQSVLKFDDAERCFQLALQNSRNDVNVLFNYSVFTLRIRKDIERAKKIALQLSKIQKNKRRSILLLAEIELASKNYHTSIDYLKKLEGKEKWARSLLLTDIAISQGKYKEAEKHLEVFEGINNHHIIERDLLKIKLYIAKRQYETANRYLGKIKSINNPFLEAKRILYMAQLLKSGQKLNCEISE